MSTTTKTAARVRKAHSEDPAPYAVIPELGVSFTAAEDAVIENALAILEHRMRKVGHGHEVSSPSAVRDFLRLKLAEREREVFVAIFLDCQNKVIEYAELFAGTLSQTSVYPREVVKAALSHNAAAVIFAHNHPSGVSTPSRADEAITQELKKALALVDVRVLDHFIVAGSDRPLSFAEIGLL